MLHRNHFVILTFCAWQEESGRAEHRHSGKGHCSCHREHLRCRLWLVRVGERKTEGGTVKRLSRSFHLQKTGCWLLLWQVRATSMQVPMDAFSVSDYFCCLQVCRICANVIVCKPGQRPGNHKGSYLSENQGPSQGRVCASVLYRHWTLNHELSGMSWINKMQELVGASESNTHARFVLFCPVLLDWARLT